MNNITRNTVFLLAAMVSIVILFPELVSACPGCNSISTGSVGRGFNTSIFFMMAMPFVIAGTVIGGMIIYRRNHVGLNQSKAETIAHQTNNKDEERKN